ncbi:MAG: S-adenosylmethionine:tRNA ribosyltransferase-isomerase [Paludibacteraceae bacterium]|jgi:S-adenosylmethionine:tRNA ribosyltransferase-isomerase|nr:S-adenosylmethionine:tRNA ribosyltransferase-isomerase [Paludibacteraceae bacterium]
MPTPQEISIDAFNYDLPDERIAKFPKEKRDESKLLLYKNGAISETIFKEIYQHLPEKELLIANNTKVIQARMLFQKESGAKVEIFCLEPLSPSDYALVFQSKEDCIWKCMVGNSRRWKEGQTLQKTIQIGDKKVHFLAERISTNGNTHEIKFSWDQPNITFAEILDAGGILPIPPYLHRETIEQDKTTYQTVYSKIKGSVAAPTAGLHFTQKVFESLKERGIEYDEVTLHVGAGTFQPVKSETIGEHTMHSEFIIVERNVIEKIKERGSVIAVGTTSVRTLESLYYIGVLLEMNKEPEGILKVTQWLPYSNLPEISVEKSMENILDYLAKRDENSIKAETQIIILPGYKFHIVKGLITNFHQPKSTLLLLISAFIGEDWKKVYDYALTHEFRFLSYGDSSLLLKR